MPFYDRTNGDETYGGGRFMDVPLNNKEEAIIDFNLAYNPYCAYTKNYICPALPLSNQLDIKIFAGEKRPLVEKSIPKTNIFFFEKQKCRILSML